MIERSTDGKQRILSLSYGKDSMACLGALEELGWPLDRIVTADVWATDTISADLPPMVEFKDYADRTILERYAIEVEHYCAMEKSGSKTTYEGCLHKPITKQAKGVENRTGLNRGFPYQKGPWCQRDLKAAALDEEKKRTYEDRFYKVKEHSTKGDNGNIYGWPFRKGQWCNSDLKMEAIKASQKTCKNTMQYIGIAADEPKRFHNLTDTKLSPLVEIGWTEADCRAWCEREGLLSPIYTTAMRGGCWFCHNQGVGQLRMLRKQYPELWALMLKWDSDSPVTFHADGHTVHDFEERFKLEDEGFIYPHERFRWSMLNEELNYRLF